MIFNIEHKVRGINEVYTLMDNKMTGVKITDAFYMSFVKIA